MVKGRSRGTNVLPRGTTQTGLRQYNERLVLSLIRREKTLPKADIARETGLTAQTISVIMNQLEADKLIVKGAPLRGRVGQPSVPYALNPDGAFSIGLKVGRRSFDLSLVDFVGTIRCGVHEAFPYPTPGALKAFVQKGLEELLGPLPASMNDRVVGLGIATPYELWSWSREVGAPIEVMQEWRDFDYHDALQDIWDRPIFVVNDATAACAAELIFGNKNHESNFLHIYIGAFVGGGVVLNSSLFIGSQENAGAIGSLPILQQNNGSPKTEQLVLKASKLTLEKKLLSAGYDTGAIWQSSDEWPDLSPYLEDWMDEAASSLALAIVSATSILDFPTIMIDGALPVHIRRNIVDRTKTKIEDYNLQGLSPFKIVEGTIGEAARTLGSASLPLLRGFALDSSVLFKAAF